MASLMVSIPRLVHSTSTVISIQEIVPPQKSRRTHGCRLLPAQHRIVTIQLLEQHNSCAEPSQSVNFNTTAPKFRRGPSFTTNYTSPNYGVSPNRGASFTVAGYAIPCHRTSPNHDANFTAVRYASPSHSAIFGT